MYRWIWERLPGPPATRLLAAVLLVGAVVALLLLVVFPGLEPLLPFLDVNVGAAELPPLG